MGAHLHQETVEERIAARPTAVEESGHQSVSTRSRLFAFQKRTIRYEKADTPTTLLKTGPRGILRRPRQDQEGEDAGGTANQGEHTGRGRISELCLPGCRGGSPHLCGTALSWRRSVVRPERAAGRGRLGPPDSQADPRLR